MTLSATQRSDFCDSKRSASPDSVTDLRLWHASRAIANDCRKCKLDSPFYNGDSICGGNIQVYSRIDIFEQARPVAADIRAAVAGLAIVHGTITVNQLS